jgi:hypothetical protein
LQLHPIYNTVGFRAIFFSMYAIKHS